MDSDNSTKPCTLLRVRVCKTKSWEEKRDGAPKADGKENALSSPGKEETANPAKTHLGREDDIMIERGEFIGRETRTEEFQHPIVIAGWSDVSDLLYQLSDC